MSTVDTATEIRPFQIEIPEEQIDDLRRRIAATRWPAKELVADRSQGVQLATLQALARYWTTEYDWRRCEARLNALPQFTTEIDGVEIHFIHVRSRHENALPLIMTHGWPGSVVELLETVGPLTDPTAHGGTAEDAFHLVLPSLPGYGFSGEPTELGWETGRIARAWAELMNRLGYTRYVAQGGDVGAAVTDAMGRQAPEGLLGIHVNLLAGALGIKDMLPAESEQERAAHDALDDVHDGRLRLLPGAVHPAADDRLLPAGLTRRAGGLDARPRHGQLLQDLPRVRRRRARGQSHPGQHPRQHHAVLADGHRRLGRPVVLGVRTVPGRGPCGRPGASAGRGSGRLHDVPRRDLGCPAQLGRDGLPRPRLLQRGRPAAATSPPGRSRSSSPPRCGRPSARCADDASAQRGRRARTVRAAHHCACASRDFDQVEVDHGDPDAARFLHYRPSSSIVLSKLPIRPGKSNSGNWESDSTGKWSSYSG